jgi:DNA-binding transcriptional LysR family regulator
MQKCIAMRQRKKGLPVEIRNWDDVRFFLAIHRAGSLSAAAGPLGVTQPTCGRRLDALEVELGVRLFDRTPDGLRITAEGRALLDAAEAMDASARELALRVATKDSDLEGLVRIATTEAFACTFLVGALSQVRAKYPGLRVELVLSNTETDLLAREADIALRFRPEGFRPTPEKLVAQKLGDEPFVLYGTNAYLQRRGVPPDPSVLAGHDVVVFDGRHPAAEWCRTAFRDANVVLSAPSLLVSMAGVAAGLGLGVVPVRAARRHPELSVLSGVVARGTGWLIVHPELKRVPRIRAVLDLLAASFRADKVAVSAA